MEPAFVYFDLDDTLLDHKHAEKKALNDLAEHFEWFNGVDPVQLSGSYREINRQLWSRYDGGYLSKEKLQELRFSQTLEKLGLDASKWPEAASFYMQAYRNHWRWNPGARDALRRVADHFEVGILTNGFADTQKLKIEKFELRSLTDRIVISEEVGYLKPQPEIFEHSTELAGTTPGQILYIGDSFSSDIEGASDYGWKTAWFTDETDREKLARADFTFNDFESVCRLLDV